MGIGSKMRDAFEAVARIYEETGLLMQTLDKQMGPDFQCPFGSIAVWERSGAYYAGRDWLVPCVSRYWQMTRDPLKGALICIEFIPETAGAFGQDTGPVVTAMALTLREPVTNNNWKFSWRDACGRDDRLFEIDAQDAPVYHSVVRQGVQEEGADRLVRIENFWLPLSALTDAQQARRAVVDPLKALASEGVCALPENEQYLRPV